MAVIGTKTCIDPSIIKVGLERTLIKHPRFSSKLVTESKMKWKRTVVDLDDHIVVPKLDPYIESPDQYVEDYMSRLTTKPMDMSKPLWELHILNLKTLDAQAVAVFRIHHSMGDGASLITLLLACTRKTLDPEALPSFPTQRRPSSGNAAGGFWGFLLAIWTALTIMWNTLCDLTLFGATILFLKDTMTPLKGTAAGVESKPKRIVYRIVSLDDIKLVKNAMNMTINDVVTGVVQAGFSRYLNREYVLTGENENNTAEDRKNVNLPKSIRLRGAVLVNLRPTMAIQSSADLMAKGSTAKWEWGNRIGYILLPFTVALPDNPLDYLRRAKATIDRKKRSLESIVSFQCNKLLLQFFGMKAAEAVAYRVFSNITCAFSNVAGPVEEISFFGHPIAFLSPTVYGNPQALTIHCQSYSNKMILVLSVDPDVIPNPHRLCDDLKESLKTIKEAVLDRDFSAVSKEN